MHYLSRQRLPGDLSRHSGNARLQVLLFDLQSAVNLGMILRVAETYKAAVHVFDRHRIFADRDRVKMVSDFACGALEREPPHVADPCELAAICGSGRLIATTIEADAMPLPEFKWRAGDLVAFGNEYDGLPEEVLAQAATRLRIPMPQGYTPKPASYNPIDPARTAPVSRDGQPSLNVSISVGILVYSAYLFASCTPSDGEAPEAVRWTETEPIG
jgi:tRNA(Leu) C34 or U34 (ribose-2'-O)-methylase TrmL